jgi:hypothetical protein
VLNRFKDLLNPGGIFITLHEPTPMAIVVESAKILVWPFAVFAPDFITDIARRRYKGEPSTTDLWMFKQSDLKLLATQSGFESMDTYAWGLLRPIIVQRYGLHTSKDRPRLSSSEINLFRKAIKCDAILNKFLPKRCFGSLCIVFKK